MARSMQEEVPLLNIETPDINGVPQFLKKQMDAEIPKNQMMVPSQQQFESQPTSNILNGAPASPPEVPLADTLGNPEQTTNSFTGPDAGPGISADVARAKGDLESIAGKESKPEREAAAGNAEQTEALREEKEANNLINSKQENFKMEDRPDVIGMGDNGISRSVDKNLMNMQSGNVASQEDDVNNMDPSSAQMNRQHFTNRSPEVDRMHEGKI